MAPGKLTAEHIRRCKQAHWQPSIADTTTDNQSLLGLAANLEMPGWITAVVAPRREHNRVAAGQTDLPSMGMAANGKIKRVLLNMRDALGRMHQHDSASTRAPEHRFCIGSTGGRFIKSADPNMVIGRRQLHIFIDKHPDANRLQLVHDQAIIRP